ncbi:DDE-type integrase/transposase/recombinase [Leisingera thetidis]|uniref:DDE-type integrase/transposase/recombinase n=1 Tax=Leisingera thetidis TaxID=2930199 RepID=UPI003D9C801C
MSVAAKEVDALHLEEVLAERGVDADHATLNRWVVQYALRIAAEIQKRKSPAGRSWRMVETYIKVKGRWCYLYGAVDKHGKHWISCYPRAATAFFAQSIGTNGWPDKVVIDKSGANLAGLRISASTTTRGFLTSLN